MLPLIFQILDTASRRGVLSWAANPRVADLVVGLGFVLVLPIFGVVAVASSERRWLRARPTGQRPTLPVTPAILLALLPPLLLFLLSRAHIVQLFVGRYMLSKEVGLAIGTAWLLETVRRPIIRTAALAMQVALALALTPFGSAHGGQDWRASSVWVNEKLKADPRTPVVLVSGFVESLDERYLENQAFRDILMAPQLAYPLMTSRVELLPWRLNDLAVRKLTDVESVARQAESVVVVSLPVSDAYEQAIARSMSAEGLQLRERQEFTSVQGRLFQR
jgi:hypothetical protein